MSLTFCSYVLCKNVIYPSGIVRMSSAKMLFTLLEILPFVWYALAKIRLVLLFFLSTYIYFFIAVNTHEHSNRYSKTFCWTQQYTQASVAFLGQRLQQSIFISTIAIIDHEACLLSCLPLLVLGICLRWQPHRSSRR